MSREAGLVAHVYNKQQELGRPLVAQDLRPFFHNLPLQSITLLMRGAGLPIVTILLMEEEAGVYRFSTLGWYSLRSTDAVVY